MAKILVVDDELAIRELLRAFLENLRHRVETAENASDALRRLRGEAFDAVFLDMHMPDMLGIELLRILRSLPGHKATPVLMCTNVSVNRDVEACFDAGANDYLIKSMLSEQKVAEKLRALLPL